MLRLSPGHELTPRGWPIRIDEDAQAIACTPLAMDDPMSGALRKSRVETPRAACITLSNFERNMTRQGRHTDRVMNAPFFADPTCAAGWY